MNYKKICCFLPVFALFIACSVKKNVTSSGNYQVKLDTLTLFDQSRNRRIPIAVYKPQAEQKIPNQQVVIFNHGYGLNKGGDYFVYSYLTEKLASKGYVTVSIQHELPTDALLPTEGNLQLVRRPFWQNGSDNILFVLNELKKIQPDLDYKHLTIIGHSNGGDMAALFGNQHPNLVYKIITMDNRRMFLPRTSVPKIYSLRSNDYPADEGVLPTEDEQKKYHMIIQPTSINHGHMDNKGSDEEKKTLNDFILTYLEEH
ncbi:alpha/beta hydrolase [Chryseobacterium lactis]|uniref:Alpha/beta hydrolase n=1 Tax=Chryseobacterium lactis TaxID=1241981 RepID=A0A3G6RI00_CHRLC|nr:alpha/beta hydrolase [Chryseobacterium lactis]AZA83444.1 alpha/beta hydrolase [Chryseobacterium lactis]AZB03828.1 alpha/beta hydrolase [Chryseobacterium lactis]PNW11595.1 alpha/beta hydrolase [Chryseobacterium lactis]